MEEKESVLLHGSQVLIDGIFQEAWLELSNGKIKSIYHAAPRPADISITRGCILPGLIDSHVHINEPGRTEWEGFNTATRAAAAGGITMLVDMPLNSSPVSTTAKALQLKLEAAKGQIHVDCGFYGGLVPGNNGDLQDLADAGVLGFKAFLSHSGIDEFPNVERQDLEGGMPIIARNMLPLLVHCELVSDHPEINLPESHPHSHDAWLRSRPKDWENKAIALMIELCRKYQCQTHIVHLSSAEAIPMLNAAIEEGLPLTVETCPHYLVFDAESIENGKTLFKCAPPIREAANNAQLWDGLRNGPISMVVTDHSPATPELKSIEEGKFSEAWGGIASLQFSLPATWTAASQRGFALEEVVEWMSGNVAKMLHIEDRKGSIAIGKDADFVIFDPEAHCDTRPQGIHHRHQVSPYCGMALKGKVLQTWLGGKIVYDDGNFPNLGLGSTILNKH